MFYLVAGICIFNIVMWIIFGIKFKKIFSPDGMMEKARNGMNGLLRSMQKNTVDNINLVNETIQKLKQAQIEAERKVEQINKKLELLQNEANMMQFNKSVSKASSQTSQPKQPAVDPNAVYEVKPPVQNDLFESYRESLTKVIQPKDETVVTETGAAYKEVPVISTKLFDENLVSDIFSKPIPKISPEKTVNEKVIYLFNNGYSVEDIAAKLSVSETEVQLIIDLN